MVSQALLRLSNHITNVAFYPTINYQTLNWRHPLGFFWFPNPMLKHQFVDECDGFRLQGDVMLPIQVIDVMYQVVATILVNASNKFRFFIDGQIVRM